MQTGLQQRRRRVSELFRIVLLLFGAQMPALWMAHRYLHSAVPMFHGSFFHGFDFEFFWAGARAWLAGTDPYRVFGFVTPPLSLLLPSLLAPLPLPRATAIFLAVNAVVLASALWWLAARGWTLRERVGFLLVAVLFVPAQWCVRGGNMDGLMLVLLVAAFTVRWPFPRALLLAASIGLKLYSVILLPVMLRRRQWRASAVTLALLVLLMLPFVRLWPAAWHALASRGDRYAYGSISPVAIVYALGGIRPAVYKGIGLAFWLGTYLWTLWRDRGRQLNLALVARYAPWMFAWPALVFPYVGVLALVVLAHLLQVAQRRPLSRVEYCRFFGFLMLGLQLDQITNGLPLTAGADIFCHILQPMGVAVMMLSSCMETVGPEEEAQEENATEEEARANVPLYGAPGTA